MNPHLKNLGFEEDILLSQYAQQYKNDIFIGTEMMPLVDVTAQDSSLEFKIPFLSNEHRQIHAGTKRALRAPVAEREVQNVSTKTFSLDDYSIRVPYDYREAQAFGSVADFEKFQTDQNQQSLLVDRELDIATALQLDSAYPAANKTTIAAADDKWDDPDSHPITQIRTGIEAVRIVSGYKPNRCLIGNAAWLTLLENPSVLAMMKTTNDKILTEEILGRWLSQGAGHTMKVVVGAPAYDSVAVTDDGSGNIVRTVTATEMYADSVILTYVPDGQITRFDASFGKVFFSRNFPIVGTYAKNDGSVLYVQNTSKYYVKVLDYSLGYIILTVNT